MRCEWALRAGTATAALTLAGLSACAADSEGPRLPPSAASSRTPFPPNASATALPPEAVPAAGPAARRRFTVVASGDLLIHPGVWWRAEREARAAGKGDRYDFLPALAQLRGLISGADLALCHLEGPLGAPGSAPRGFPLFSIPPELATAIQRLGYDSCSTSSNHGIDQGEAGVNSTLAALDDVGVAHVGTARNAAEDASAMLRAAGVTVAHLSYTYGHNNTRPADKPWLINTLADDTIVADARAARAAGAEVVIASIHWGQEYVAAPTPAQVALATTLMSSGQVDLVLGHHAHVVQPVEAFGDRYVAYGMGNLISAISHDFANGASREGILPRFTFTRGGDGRWRVTEIVITPTYVSPVGGLHTVDVAADLRRKPAGEDLARLRRARERTAAVIYSRDVDDDVVRVR
ncbi:MAG: CapA family protein [Sporichthyaceae bacterium]